MKNHSYKLFRIYGYPGFGVLLYLILVLLNSNERNYSSWRYYVLPDFLLEFMFSTAYAALLFETGIQLTKILDCWYPWETRMKSRFTIQLSLHVAIVLMVLNLFFKFNFPAHFDYDELMSRQTIIVGIIFCLLVTAVFAAEYFFYRWNEASLKTLELEQHTTQAQLEALKLQLDPHFLFNNLSIVTALIEDQPAIAIPYITKLSSIYRYMLANRMKDLITLAEELEFIKAYLYLFKIRYGDGIKVDIGDIESPSSVSLPPLTLQLLIENAIKHNVFSLDAPLFIQIYFPDGQSMVVENNRISGIPKAQGNHIGLENIRERYRLLDQQSPVITYDNHIFKVETPLITIK